MIINDNSHDTLIDIENSNNYDSNNNNNSNSNNSNTTTDSLYYDEVKIVVPKCFKTILTYLYQCIKNVFIQIIKLCLSNSIHNKIRVIIFVYDNIDSFYNFLWSTWINNIALGLSKESLNNTRTSRLREVGVTEKHMERCENMYQGIVNEFYFVIFFQFILKYMVFPYIIDGSYIREIVKKLFSSNNGNTSNGDGNTSVHSVIFISCLLVYIYIGIIVFYSENNLDN